MRNLSSLFYSKHSHRILSLGSLHMLNHETFLAKVNMFFSPLLINFLYIRNSSPKFSAIFWPLLIHVKSCRQPSQTGIISKFFIGNIVPRVGHKDFLHLLQPIFMFALLTNGKINLGLSFLNYVNPNPRAVQPSTPAIQNLSLILDCSYHHFVISVFHSTASNLPS